MWNIDYNLKKLIHKKDGFEYINSFDTYSPISEIGLDVIVRQESKIPILYEMILKLIEVGYNNVDDIAEYSGVEMDILNDVLGDMSVDDLIYITCRKIITTFKGKETLKTLMESRIEKETIKGLFIDLIDGRICDELEVCKKVPKNVTWLNKEIRIDNDFIQKKFEDINRIYYDRQHEYNENVSKEIYQILGVKYETIVYLKKKFNIFQNTLDGSIIIEPENKFDDYYQSCLINQINNNKQGAIQFLINSNQFDKRRYTYEDKIDENLMSDTKTLETNINKKEIKYGDELDSVYFSDRYLLPNELNKILYALKNIKPRFLSIKSRDLFNILTDNIIEIIKTLLQHTSINVVINYDISEYKVDELINKILSKVNNIKNIDKKLIFIKEDIQDESILIYPHALIKISKEPIKYKNLGYILKDKSIIYFDTDLLEDEKNKLSSLII